MSTVVCAKFHTVQSESKKRRGHAPGNKIGFFNLNQPVRTCLTIRVGQKRASSGGLILQQPPLKSAIFFYEHFMAARHEERWYES